MATDSLGTSIKGALGQDVSESKEDTLKLIDENWDKHDGKTTLGQRLHDFFFVTPTGKNLGLPQVEPGKKLSKGEAMKLINEKWDHPFPRLAPHPHEHHASSDTRTIGERAHDFFLTVPTDKNLGLPPVDKKLSKDEAMKVIAENWDHPFHHDHHHEAPHKEEHKEGPHKTFGQKLYKFLFEIPTEENLGLPHEPAMSKEEKLKAIEKSWDHPFKHINM